MCKLSFILPLIASLILSACATSDLGDALKKKGTTEKRDVTGSVGRPAVGAVITPKARGKNAPTGAAGDSPAATAPDSYLDTQTKDFQSQLQSEIQRGEVSIDKRNSDHVILITMASTVGFDNLSSVIKPAYLPILNKISQLLNEYDKTKVKVISHTDSIGPGKDNLRLSERRARSIVDYLVRQNVNPLRLQSYGKGETQPRADNHTEAGRQLNQRVELWIQPVVAE